jgi:hypothetical protein
MNQGEYDRVVIGYHGTREETAIRIVNHQSTFRPSKNDHDWLGHGIYFWEHAPQQAWKWARRHYAESSKIAVLGSLIRLGTCFDLLDPENSKALKSLHENMKRELARAGEQVPKNVRANKYLDCATLEYAYAALESESIEVQTCRGAYVPTGSGDRLWSSSWLSKDAHIQLCVRDPACIIGTWLLEPQSP